MKTEFTEAAYQALVQDIFRRFPSVQKEGFTAGAYKPGLERMQAFEAALGHPSRRFRSIHIAGTNGKGSVANMLASALGACGLRTGLFTSPHLIDFRERMCIASPGDGLIPKEYVFDFLTHWMPWITEHQLSFFEITTGLAFKWFADQKVDVAVIETGLGGRLDSTNILEKPDLTVVTSIGLDHMALLGNTLAQIAAEKAGIFKADVPALVGETHPETAPVFQARRTDCPGSLVFADQVTPSLWDRHPEVLSAMDLQADIQKKNLRTVLAALDILRQSPGYEALANSEALLDGIAHTARNMGFHGRWERLQERPTVIADIGHNAHALRHNFAQLESALASGKHDALIIIYGIMADKDLDAILPLMPKCATCIFTTPDTPRALPAAEIMRKFSGNALLENSVAEAVKKALSLATPDTLIYIGGSTFVVAEALPLYGHNN
ncbi:MAG: bifunctional folylpolyglutamate synthase/dihydrofolate synthase [Bacteroidales bacterium]|nr:bifunctional folylpolyglutamate synthase/dihydrofolate synthase [Bacteroidales bacterium]